METPGDDLRTRLEAIAKERATMKPGEYPEEQPNPPMTKTQELEVVADLARFNDWLMSIRIPGHEITALQAGNAMLRAKEELINCGKALADEVETRLAAEAERDALRHGIDEIADFDSDGPIDPDTVHLIRIAGAARRAARQALSGSKEK